MPNNWRRERNVLNIVLMIILHTAIYNHWTGLLDSSFFFFLQAHIWAIGATFNVEYTGIPVYFALPVYFTVPKITFI